MVITRHGLECFKIQFGDTVLVFNPPSKKSKYQSVRFSADIALVSVKHEDFNGVDTVPAKGDNLFVIDGPGGGGKIPLSPDYVVSHEKGRYVLRNYAGRQFIYHDPE